MSVYHGDCREILLDFPACYFDLLLTDPPYGMNYSTGHRNNIVRATTKIKNDEQTSVVVQQSVEIIKPLLSETAQIYWFSASSQIDIQMNLVRSLDAKIINMLVWDKGNCTAGDLPATYGKQWEAILFARKQRVLLRGARDRDILRFSRGASGKNVHPTQKPVELIKFLLSKHNETGTVLDPFGGSGTTAVASLELKRSCVIIELEERFCEITAQRLENTN